MKIFQFVALFALVNAAWAATNEKDELHRANGEMEELGSRMARHLREGRGSRAIKDHTKKMRRAREEEEVLDEKRSEKRAANAEKIRKVADGVKKQQRHKLDPRMAKLEAAKLTNHSKAAKEQDAPAKSEKVALDAEKMQKMSKQIPQHKLNNLGMEGAEKLKTLPDVKKAGKGVKEQAARAKKVAPGSMKGAQEKLEKMAEKVKAAQDENEN